jgi:hypothetical protein
MRQPISGHSGHASDSDLTSRTARGWLRDWGGALVVGGALATVTVVAGFISYTHICALTLQLHQSWKTAHLTPLAVDGQLAIGSAVLATATGRQKHWGWLGVLPGLGESLFANWESGIVHGYTSAIWATVAAQAFAVSSFLFERWLKSRISARGQGGDIRPATAEEALGALLSAGSERAIAAVLEVERGQVQRWKRMLAAASAEAAPDPSMNGGQRP